MKELHHHIFSNTACISKETMLRYINKQLSNKEVHDIQKHLIDCEFCSEALEGMKYAKDSSALFTIDHKIDQRVIGKKSSVIKTLMIAATFLVIVFGSYFTYSTYSDVVSNNESKISLNMVPEKEEGLSQPNYQEEATATEELKNLEQRNEEGEMNVQQSIPAPLTSQPIVAEVLEILEDDIEEIDEEEAPAEYYSYNDRNEEQETTTISANDKSIVDSEDGFYNRKDNVFREENQKNETLKVESKLAEEIVMDEKAPAPNFGFAESGTIVSGETSTISSSNVAGKKGKTRAKKESTKQSAYKAKEDKDIAGDFETTVGGMVNSVDASIDDRNVDNDNFIDLAKEQAEEEKEIDLVSEMDKSKGLGVKSAIENGIDLYNEKKYEEALIQLETSIKNNSLELNKALWYKALCLIELKQIENAKIALQTIISNNDTYVEEAKTKLIELK